MPLSITGAAWSIWGAAPGIRAPGQRCSHLRCASNDGKEVSLREFLLQLPPYRRRKVQQPAHPASGAGIRTGPAEVPLKPLRRGHLGPRRGARRRDAVAAALANGGVFAVDKPAGPTSADVVAGVLEAVTKKLKVKLGHGGTLDPFATGVLVLGLGHGTRMLQKFLHGGKEYVATVQMGTETDTQDYTGHALRRCRFDHVRREVLEEALPGFRGTISQVPPMFSALKVNGQRLYKLAMEGQDVPRPAWEVQVDELELLEFQPPHFTLRVRCGGGLYVRTLGHDLAQAVGTVGHVTSLRRIAVGEFREADCLTLEEALDPQKIATRLRRCSVPKRPKKRLLSATSVNRDAEAREPPPLPPLNGPP